MNADCENSEYANQCYHNKNCYMTIATDLSEDCYYVENSFSCRNCIDCLGLHDCELCIESINSIKCYKTFFSRDCVNCSDCLFSSFCRGCTSCFGCCGLRNKKYCFFNDQLTKEDYEKRIREIELTPSAIALYRKKAYDFELTLPHPHAILTNCENSTGDYIENSKNAIDCYDGRNVEDSKYCSLVPLMTKDCYDITGGSGTLFYECFSVGPGSNNLFCGLSWNDVYNLLYCFLCVNNSRNLFGCVGMKHGKYCILNRQYSKEEFEELVPKIIVHMQKTGEWGEMFPSSLSPFGYNETIAQEYFPLSEKEARKKNFKWRHQRDEPPNVKKIVDAQNLPERINDIPDDILNWAIRCEVTGRPFRLITQELDFYRRQNLPVPSLHPDERHRRRFSLRNPRKLWTRTCTKCRTEIQTSYAPERPEIVYCENCYLREMY